MLYRICGIGKEKGVEDFRSTSEKRSREFRFHPNRKKNLTASSSKKSWI
jgi:hypothetical protein